MHVELISHTPNPEQAIAAAAKLCYSNKEIADLREKIDEDSAAKFVDMLMDIGHESPMEHISFTFGIEDVSRTFLAQITRHRLASYSVQSQRYVSLENFTYVIPPEIEKDPVAKAAYLEAMDAAAESYHQLSEILTGTHVATLMAEGVEEKEAKRRGKKMAIEDARFVLPGGCTTKMIVTMNARSLKNFFAHRCCNRAQWEIRDVATEMLALVREIAPTVFKHCGPPCVTGPCPEGKMSCGQVAEMKKRYGVVK